MAKKKTVKSNGSKTVAPDGEADVAAAKPKAPKKRSARPKPKPRPRKASAAPGPAKAPARAEMAVPTAADADDRQPKPLTDTQLRKVKTGLTKKDLEHYRTLLLQKRAEIVGDVAALETDARTDSGDHLSPEHMADIGSNNYEQEFTLGLVATERRMLLEIDQALIRIRERTYGVCLERGIPIGRARLDAKPWAKYCIEVVREKESRGEL